MTPTREQVIQWARELGIIPPHPYVVPTDAQLEAVRKFAETQFSAGQQAEREKLERVAWMFPDDAHPNLAGKVFNDGPSEPGDIPLYRVREEQ